MTVTIEKGAEQYAEQYAEKGADGEPAASADKASANTASADKASANTASADKASADKGNFNNAEPLNLKNDVRTFGQFLYQKFINSCIGYYYLTIHYLFVIFGALVILFSQNINFLAIIAFLVILDAAAIIVLHHCPLTILEQKYLKVDYAQETKNVLKKCNIMYNCPHAYESQLEYVINIWCLAVLKILAIMLMKVFSVTVKSA